jgi:hypothetical protein
MSLNRWSVALELTSCVASLHFQALVSRGLATLEERVAGELVADLTQIMGRHQYVSVGTGCWCRLLLVAVGALLAIPSSLLEAS